MKIRIDRARDGAHEGEEAVIAEIDRIMRAVYGQESANQITAVRKFYSILKPVSSSDVRIVSVKAANPGTLD